MKKLIYTVSLGLFILTGCSSTTENVTKKSVEPVKVEKKQITQAECEKHLGKENFDFIADVYNSKATAMLKCKEAMLSN